MQNRFLDKVPIYYDVEGFEQLNLFLQSNKHSKVFVLVDDNTKKHCLPILKKEISLPYILLNIPSGEINKNLDTCQLLWQMLTDHGADRQSIVLNLGGGVLTDIGGFVSATYKRGISFINIPTTLLGMVDAAIGGKTGIDFNHLKNQIGLFVNPEMICVNPEFLNTLPKRELFSGLAEVIKYGLIADAKIWKSIKIRRSKDFEINGNIIRIAAGIKEKIVAKDPKEKGIRKTLNFGHTIGHAIETHFLSKPKNKQLLHGEAIAIGIILASHLSYQTQGLALKVLDEITSNVLRFFIDTIPVKILKKDFPFIIELLKHDKKNDHDSVNFILINNLGKPVIDCQVSNQAIFKAFEYYNLSVKKIKELNHL